jgi:CRISPR-associated protein Csd1
MIINKLVDYYDRLAADPNEDIAPYGFSRQKISFEIVLNPDGTLHSFADASVEDGKRRVPQLLVVPGQAKPSGSGINPGFLWDNAQYMLGFKPDDPKPERTQRAFEAFRARHLALRDEIDDEAYQAVCSFLEAWSPEQAGEHPELADVAASHFGVFRIVGAREYVHDRPAVLAYIRDAGPAEPDAPVAPSLVSGQMQPIARLHKPPIKNVGRSKPPNATLVNFNATAYESYGKKDSYNAPVGAMDAFKYCTALNRLTGNPQRRVLLADTSVVYWSERPTSFENEFIQVLDSADAKDDVQLARVAAFFDRLQRAADGAPFDHATVSVGFYVAGLEAPNPGRISVRFWLVGTVQQFAERLGRHLKDLEIGGKPPHAPPITVQRIIDQTARERKDISPLLGGAVSRAVLTGGRYPASLLAAVLRRVRADGQTDGVNGHIRASIVKAYLVRDARLNAQQETIGMSLDPECPHMPYHLGRLFAVLEKVQEEALGHDLNVTIKDRFFSSASANPVAAFPRLLRLHAHHLDKLTADKQGLKVVREKLVQEICARIDARKGFPTHLPLDQQGQFFIGYYHQRQDLFTKKTDSNNTTSREDN